MGFSKKKFNISVQVCLNVAPIIED